MLSSRKVQGITISDTNEANVGAHLRLGAFEVYVVQIRLRHSPHSKTTLSVTYLDGLRHVHHSKETDTRCLRVEHDSGT